MENTSYEMSTIGAIRADTGELVSPQAAQCAPWNKTEFTCPECSFPLTLKNRQHSDNSSDDDIAWELEDDAIPFFVHQRQYTECRQIIAIAPPCQHTVATAKYILRESLQHKYDTVVRGVCTFCDQNTYVQMHTGNRSGRTSYVDYSYEDGTCDVAVMCPRHKLDNAHDDTLLCGFGFIGSDLQRPSVIHWGRYYLLCPDTVIHSHAIWKTDISLVDLRGICDSCIYKLDDNSD